MSNTKKTEIKEEEEAVKKCPKCGKVMDCDTITGTAHCQCKYEEPKTAKEEGNGMEYMYHIKQNGDRHPHPMVFGTEISY